MSLRLENQLVIITGASRGIGLSMAHAFANEGASLLLVSRNQVALENLAKSLPIDSSRVMVQALDVTNRDACFAVVEKAITTFGRVDTLINNAGVYRAKPFLEYVPQDFADMLDVNFYGAMHMMQATLPHMYTRKKGSIINIASTAGKWGSLNQSAYNVSKHAIVGLTRCVALEAAAHKVTVNAICPGFVETEMLEELKSQGAQSAGATYDDFEKAALARVPLKRAMKPEEIASLAVFLASKDAANMTGQSIQMDGGMILI